MNLMVENLFILNIPIAIGSGNKQTIKILSLIKNNA